MTEAGQTKPNELAGQMQEVTIDDSDSSMEYEEVPEYLSDSESDEEDMSAMLQTIKRSAGEQPEEETPAPSTSKIQKKPTVVDDFIRNFLIKMKMSKTLDKFQQSEIYLGSAAKGTRFPSHASQKSRAGKEQARGGHEAAEKTLLEL